MSGDYKVGKGKPPKHTQFRKGRSGNPKGRPKNSKNVHTVLQDIWNGKITVRENGQTRRIPFSEAFIMKLADKAINGSVNDQLKLLKAISDFAPDLVEDQVKDLEVKVRYVLPNGKSVKDYDKQEPDVKDEPARSNNVTYVLPEGKTVGDYEPREPGVNGDPTKDFPREDDDSWLN